MTESWWKTAGSFAISFVVSAVALYAYACQHVQVDSDSNDPGARWADQLVIEDVPVLGDVTVGPWSKGAPPVVDEGPRVVVSVKPDIRLADISPSGNTSRWSLTTQFARNGGPLLLDPAQFLAAGLKADPLDPSVTAAAAFAYARGHDVNVFGAAATNALSDGNGVIAYNDVERHEWWNVIGNSPRVADLDITDCVVTSEMGVIVDQGGTAEGRAWVRLDVELSFPPDLEQEIIALESASSIDADRPWSSGANADMLFGFAPDAVFGFNRLFRSRGEILLKGLGADTLPFSGCAVGTSDSELTLH